MPELLAARVNGVPAIADTSIEVASAAYQGVVSISIATINEVAVAVAASQGVGVSAVAVFDVIGTSITLHYVVSLPAGKTDEIASTSTRASISVLATFYVITAQIASGYIASSAHEHIIGPSLR